MTGSWKLLRKKGQRLPKRQGFEFGKTGSWKLGRKEDVTKFAEKKVSELGKKEGVES